MKQFFNILAGIIDSIAQARTATVLVRQGRIEEAKKVYD